MYQIITFYEFKDMISLRPLDETKRLIREAMERFEVKGTLIIAEEGFNGTICADAEKASSFIDSAESILKTRLVQKVSHHAAMPFRKIDVKIKPEIVTLRKNVRMELGLGTHIKPHEWNRLVAEDDVLILDARNDYEYKNGTFRGAVNPQTKKFSELPQFVAENFDAAKHKKVAMFCTGGIRCEKFAPYLKSLGFKNVYQLEGGILKYLAEVDPSESKWEGECFVFDDRRTVDEKLEKGTGPDYSQLVED